MSSRNYHLVVWGCTGYTGQLVCKYIAEQYGLPNDDFKYAIAGRSQPKLDMVEADILASVPESAVSTKDTKSIPKIMASADDEKSVDEMVKSTQCILTLSGPYALCGEVILKSCARNGTHYVDITGEVDWVAKMRQLYNDEAVKNKTKIIMCAGFDYVPNDASMFYLANTCTKRSLKLKDVTQYLKVQMGGVSGGTLRSIYEMIRRRRLSELGQQDQFVMCDDSPPADSAVRNTCHYKWMARERGGWTAPHLMGPGMEQYVRWSDAIQNYLLMGNETLFRVAAIYPSLFSALKATCVHYFSCLFLFVLAKVPGVSRCFTPQSGHAIGAEGKESSDSGKNYCTCHAHAIDGAAKPKTIETQMEWRGEPYKLTARTATEAAMATVFNSTPIFGVMSPTAALGEEYISRLKAKAGVSFSLVSIS